MAIFRREGREPPGLLGVGRFRLTEFRLSVDRERELDVVIPFLSKREEVTAPRFSGRDKPIR